MSVRQRLFPVSPYVDFKPLREPDNQGWNSNNPIFQKIIAEIKPSLLIEVGSWKGASAINMASHLKSLGLVSEIVCVDTWLGAMEFWNPDDAERYESLRLQHGYPTVYYTFLTNVVHAGFQDIITPFPLSSVSAALWFRKHHIEADVIYVDASHEFEDVRADLEAYWPVLRKGGVIFGDDFVANWPGVVQATRQFADKLGLALEEHDGFWLMRKPSASGIHAVTPSALNSANADILRFAIHEAMLETMCSEEMPRASFFELKNIQRVSFEQAVLREPLPEGASFTRYSPSRCQLHPPPPTESTQLEIPGVTWAGFTRFFVLVSLPHVNAPDVEFTVRIFTPDETLLLEESKRVVPLAVIGWHFALPQNIPEGSLLHFSTHVPWAAKNEYAWATWSSPMLFS